MPKLDNHTIIGTIWVFRNRFDKNIIILHYKVKLVAKGYNREEGINCSELLLLLLNLKL